MYGVSFLNVNLFPLLRSFFFLYSSSCCSLFVFFLSVNIYFNILCLILTHYSMYNYQRAVQTRYHSCQSLWMSWMRCVWAGRSYAIHAVSH